MAKEENKKQEKESPEEKKKTVTAFLLMFPAVLTGAIGMLGGNLPFWANTIIVGLLILQFIMLEQFIKDFYKYI